MHYTENPEALPGIEPVSLVISYQPMAFSKPLHLFDSQCPSWQNANVKMAVHWVLKGENLWVQPPLTGLQREHPDTSEQGVVECGHLGL